LPITGAVGTTPTRANGERSYIVRQPILDERHQVFAYELLSRDTGAAASSDATARTIDAAVLSIGLDKLTGGRLAFLRASRELLLREVATLLSPEGVVLSLSAELAADARIVEACRALHDRGYTLALDDYGLAEDAAKAVLPYVDFARIGSGVEAPELARIASELRAHGIRAIAERVESYVAFEQARAAGCRLFQGFYFCQPRAFSVKAIGARPMTQVALMAALNQEHVTLGAVEELLKRDPRLSLRVLRSVNSAAFGLRREIHSIREALLLLGLHQVRKWASVWALAGVNGGSPELVSVTVIRARCCELLGARVDAREGGAEYFLLGLCSLLDVILDRAMSEAIDELPLTDEMRGALLGQPNRARSVLDAVIQHERGDWDEAAASASQVGLPSDAVADAYHQSLAWARQVAAAAA
jgi:EAL and modified HD-GYP domain-containing signal transduction protein